MTDDRLTTELTSRIARVEKDVSALSNTNQETNAIVKRIDGYLSGDEFENKDGLIRRVKILEGLAVARLDILKSHESLIDEAHTKIQEHIELVENQFEELKMAPYIKTDSRLEFWKIAGIGVISALVIKMMENVLTFLMMKH